MKYSVFNLVRQATRGHQDWPRAWRNVEPKKTYDVLIIGGGGHGLATAFYLAKNHGISNIAVLEKGAIGLGNTGRNTTIVRSNYLLDENAHFYEFSLKLWENLGAELNFNVMYSPRGVLNVANSDAQLEHYARRGNAMQLNGIDAELLTREQVKDFVPLLNCSLSARYPVTGGLLHRRGGTARHDAVTWGYARAADTLGVDIIQNCEVVGLRVKNGHVIGVNTTRGAIDATKVGITVAGHSSQIAAMANIKLPIESHLLQAFVTEPLKPVLDTVVAFGAAHFYVNQTDKGELVMGGDLDGYNSFAQRGNLPEIQHAARNLTAMFPCFSRLRMLRSWGGVMDMTMDGSPIIGKLPVDGLYISGGWCYGGFKATPASGWTLAHTIAHDEPHSLNAPFSLERFVNGRVLDEHGSGPFPWLH